MAGVVGMHDQVNFKTREALEDYVANEIARFVRDKMFELNNHPMDYQDHYDYVKELYLDYLEERI